MSVLCTSNLRPMSTGLQWRCKRKQNVFSWCSTKMTFSINDFFSKCDQIRKKLRIWTHLLKKSLMEIFIFLFHVKVIREGRKLTTCLRYTNYKFIFKFRTFLSLVPATCSLIDVSKYAQFGLNYVLNIRWLPWLFQFHKWIFQKVSE